MVAASGDKLGDFVDEAILEGCEALRLGGYFHPERRLVSLTLWDRYGNPLESLLHGIIRQNMGAMHHMFGRNHANVGDYFDPYARCFCRGRIRFLKFIAGTRYPPTLSIR